MLRQLPSIPGLVLAAACCLACSASPTGSGDAPRRDQAAGSPSDVVPPDVVPPDVVPPDEVPQDAPDEVPPEAASPGSAPRPVSPPPDEDLLTAELSTIGWDQLSGSPVVLLRELDSGQVLPIWIGMAEARAISFELHGVELSRPMTHDLLTNLLATLGAVLEEVVVSDLREGTYYGLLKLRVNGEADPRWVDTRPSDGLALALRTDAKIRVARKLIEELPDYQFMAPESPDQVVRALGLTVVAPSPDLREELSLPDRPGLVVIAASGEAKRQGLARGDLIVALDGRLPTEPLDLLESIEESAAQALSVTYLRGGEETTVELDLSVPERPKSENVA